MGAVILAVDLGKTSCRAAAGGRRAEGAGAPGLAAPGGVRAAEAAILAVARELGPVDKAIVGAARCARSAMRCWPRCARNASR